MALGRAVAERWPGGEEHGVSPVGHLRAQCRAGCDYAKIDTILATLQHVDGLRAGKPDDGHAPGLDAGFGPRLGGGSGQCFNPNPPKRCALALTHGMMGKGRRTGQARFQ